MKKESRFKASVGGKYNAKEVDAYIEKMETEYKQESEARQLRIMELRDANRELSAIVDEYKKKEGYAAEVVMLARTQAERIEREAMERTRRELEKLEAEVDRWRRLLASYNGRMNVLRQASADAVEQFMAGIFYDAQRAGAAPSAQDIIQAQSGTVQDTAKDEQDVPWDQWPDETESAPQPLDGKAVPVDPELEGLCQELIPDNQ